jgi:hypothetical protein
MLDDDELANDELRAFLARLLGWSDERAVEHAIRSLETAADQRAALVLCGAGDMVPIAHALHRRALGADRRFITCDPHRGDVAASVRSPANRAGGVAALAAAAGGSLCVRTRRLPRDFPALVGRLRRTDDVLFIVCIEHDSADPLLVRPAPIVVPPLASRTTELDRVIAEYAADAVAELGAPSAGLTYADRAWVRQNATTSLGEVEKATLRLVALRASRNVSGAAAWLRMSAVSLSRWLGRRRLPMAPSGPAPATGDPPRAVATRRGAEVRRPTPTLAEIWEGRVLQMLEEGQEGREHPFEFDEVNIRFGAEQWLARIKSGPASLWSREAIAGLEALLADLDVRLASDARPRSDKPKR